MSETTACSFCSSAMTPIYLYVRGLGAALHLSAKPDVGVLSRANLHQIDLDKISRSETGGQAVIGAYQCESCDAISFKMSG